MTPDQIVDEFVSTGIEAEQAGVLPQAMRQLADECGGGPDTTGLCEECGTRLSRDGGGHKPGCWPKLALFVVSATRLVRWHGRRVWTS